MLRKTVQFLNYRDGYAYDVFDKKTIKYYFFGILIYTKEIQRH